MEKGKEGSDLFQKVIPLSLEEEIKHSYIDYAMSVIVGRALPDARDGLKPVQRRILYAMRELGLRHNQPFKKSARVVGETMGKYHPHGDAAIYETMVRMSQDFSMRYPLVDGQGNFGSIDGDPPAAMRYTEARLHALGEEMLADIDEDTVDWLPNFDESLEEPAVLPSRIPNLLVNGSTGIAVGMATNMPPHNLREVVDACCAMLDNPEVEIGELMSLMPGPDFPTGGVILGRDGIVDAYATGRGKITVRGCAEIEDAKRGKKAIVITQIPYMVNKSTLIETIVDGVQKGQLDGITDVRDESNREGIRLVLELHRDSDPHLVLRQLYSRTQLQTTFGVINLALVDGRPVELDLKGLLQIFIDHRRTVVRRRTEYRLRKAEERAHILEGLVKALGIIDRVIALIRSSSDPAVAKGRLVEELSFSEAQAQAILDMRLQRLTSLEIHKLQEELDELRGQIAWYRRILEDSSELDGVVRKELLEVKAAYGDERRTVIEDSVDDVSAEDLIPETEIVVAMTRDGFIRRMPLQDYRCQSRGGKGVKGASTKGDDEVSLVAVTTTHRTLYLFTDRGRVFALKCLALPEPKSGRGKHVGSFISLDEGESVVTFRDSVMERAKFVFLLTRMGLAKRLPVAELEGITRAGRRILGLEDGDTIARVRFTGGDDELLLTTAKGQTLRVSEEEFRPQGRAAKGVKAIKLEEGDAVVGCDVIIPGRQVLFISQLGLGKRTPYEEFTTHHRGGMGVRAMRLNDKTGDLVGAWGVAEDDELMVVTSRGRVIRMAAREISTLSRMATGSTVVRLDEGDSVADVTVIRCSVEEEG
ncbi:DNA gyrase, A subunit [Thermanaerovibrio velox DSM 12556]|uniref:DNA gyrase subunit A n=1 Tax=Thermanaerovibrio velox DSM 12556 TaxID=926567 RepID=H0UPS6_9BACT|nr:DNA gyrase subunit A [Thermanaerovibrio velox]EHM10635.1 DNA gyrase, A subunit [Thermanaerovibrio velox DSM 12556]